MLSHALSFPEFSKLDLVEGGLDDRLGLRGAAVGIAVETIDPATLLEQSDLPDRTV